MKLSFNTIWYENENAKFILKNIAHVRRKWPKFRRLLIKGFQAKKKSCVDICTIHDGYRVMDVQSQRCLLYIVNFVTRHFLHCEFNYYGVMDKQSWSEVWKSYTIDTFM
jgi:hypothetical protein